MGFSSDDYPYISKTGIKTQVNKRSDYQRNFLDAMKVGHEIFICNIYSDEYLKTWSNQIKQQSKQLDLDSCYIVSDMSFTSSQFSHISPFINQNSFQYLTQDILVKYIMFVTQYCGYLGIKCLTIPFIQGKQELICRVLNKLEQSFFKAKIGVILHVKLTQKLEWEQYIQFRKTLDPNVKIDLTLQFTASLPAKNIIAKWMAQKIYFFSFSQDCYVMNNTGNSVLSLPYENLAKSFFKLKAGYIFTMATTLAEDSKGNPILYFRYISHVFQIMVKNSTKREIHARGLYQTLLHPLQPYADNLQSQTYSIFQFDAPKYEQYAVAVLLAFQRLQITNRNIIVYYIGSGRGALIPGIISASKATKKKVTIYAIEKNPFAIQSLKRRIKDNKWSNIVKIVRTDVKKHTFQEKPDIFFSQLLGGIGDNQLSPQCLKWAQDKIQDKSKLICIPQKYTSFLKPVSYPSIHRSLKKNQKQGYFTVNIGWHYSPFKSQSIWQFQHPLQKPELQALNKSSLTQFIVPQNITIHGFLGSFDCNLFGSSYFSIVPQTQTIDMYSWYPIYFAFFQQEYLKKGQIITIKMDRIYTEKKVWYQWAYQTFTQDKQLIKSSKIHNQNGRQNSIFL